VAFVNGFDMGLYNRARDLVRQYYNLDDTQNNQTGVDLENSMCPKWSKDFFNGTLGQQTSSCNL
jgi:hypothetical protein